MALFLVTMVSGVFAFYQLTALPPLEADSRPLPNPNGFDAVKSVVQRLTPTAGDLLLLSKTASAATLRKELQPDLEDLDALHEALQLPYLTPPVTPERAMADPTNGIGAAIREGARKLVAKSRMLAAEGRTDDAMESALDSIALGIKAGRGGTMIDTLVGNACVALGHAEASRLVEGLEAAALRRHRQRLEALIPEAAGEKEVLKVERRLSRMLSRRISGGSPAGRFMDLQLDQLYKEALAETAKPSTQRLPTPAAASPYGAALAKVIPDMRKSLEKRDRLLTGLQLKMAIEEYRKSRGQLPASLDEMIPGILAEPPLDLPSRRPLKYRRIGDSYNLSPI